MSRLRSAVRWILTGYNWAWPLGYLAGLLVGLGHFVPGVVLAVVSPWIVDRIDHGARALADRIDPPLVLVSEPTYTFELPGGVMTISGHLSPAQIADLRRSLGVER